MGYDGINNRDNENICTDDFSYLDFRQQKKSPRKKLKNNSPSTLINHLSNIT